MRRVPLDGSGGPETGARFDTSFARAARDFDRLAASVFRMAEGAAGGPAYDVVRTSKDAFEIVLALPGFAPDEVEVTSDQGSLVVSGRPAGGEDVGASYLHRGIVKKPFVRRFRLATHVKVTSAGMDQGLLRIALERRLPEAKKPRTIAVETARAA
jgi:molecular chaperone IbpA